MSVFFKVNGTVRIRRFERDLFLGKISEVLGGFWLKTGLMGIPSLHLKRHGFHVLFLDG